MVIQRYIWYWDWELGSKYYLIRIWQFRLQSKHHASTCEVLDVEALNDGIILEKYHIRSRNNVGFLLGPRFILPYSFSWSICPMFPQDRSLWRAVVILSYQLEFLGL